ncbi:hypothetical protein [Virgibacillus profundi]|uniref:hypothetical protein n=1 Tax=Virgibacillus profundi TaxID=2024555 RepID=UPI000C294E9F|nr:hypothetical protein CIT14_00435 [Virgibacillus profundi]
MYEDSCGRKGIGETPQCVARGGSPAARGKRSIFPERILALNQRLQMIFTTSHFKSIKNTYRSNYSIF